MVIQNLPVLLKWSLYTFSSGNPHDAVEGNLMLQSGGAEADQLTNHVLRGPGKVAGVTGAPRADARGVLLFPFSSRPQSPLQDHSHQFVSTRNNVTRWCSCTHVVQCRLQEDQGSFQPPPPSSLPLGRAVVHVDPQRVPSQDVTHASGDLSSASAD